MKLSPQYIDLNENESFLVQGVQNSYFETDRHQHIAYELILFTKGFGTAIIGNKAIPYTTGDIFLLGSNLSHEFQKHENVEIRAIVVLFMGDCWGHSFMNMPECRDLKQLLQTAGYGLQLSDDGKYQVQSLMQVLSIAVGFNRLMGLLHCLQAIATSKKYVIISPQPDQLYQEDERINKVLQFTKSSFQDPITLCQVAAIACMSVPSFCHYFKRRTQKTFIDFLNEVRVNYACRQLLQTNKPVTDIGYESGYNTIAHFHRQFLRIKKRSPLQFRKVFFTRNDL